MEIIHKTDISSVASTLQPESLAHVSHELLTSNSHTECFSLKGTYVAKCVKVYDGDTCWLTFARTPYETVKRFVVRLNGYNSAELKSKNPEEHTAAVAAQKALHDAIYNKIVDVNITGEDLYGRALAYIHADGRDINKFMVDSGHGHTYTGRGEKLWKAEDLPKVTPSAPKTK